MSERDEIAENIRVMMLQRLLDEAALPGSERPVAFPDFRFIIEAESLLIADDHLTESFPLPSIGKPVEVMAESDLGDLAASEGDRFYVYFQPVEWRDGQVRVALEARMAPAQPDVSALGLGGVSAVFEERGGEWIVVEGPVVMAI